MRDANGNLDHLLDPISTDEFFKNYWGQNVLHIPRNDPGYYDDIVTFDDVNAYLSRTDLRYPYIRMVQNGRELPLDNYGYDYVFGENIFQGNLNLDKIFSLYNTGATMCLQMQQLALPKLVEFTNRFQDNMGIRTQSTLFLTPPNSQGFTAHYDSHDFFIFQIKGEKIWNFYDVNEALPLAKKKVLDSEVRLNGSAQHQKVLRPGDLLYVPRGVYHDALTNDEASLQISFGVFPPLWTEVLHTIIDELADKNIEFRRAAPLPELQPDKNIQQAFSDLLEVIANTATPEATLDRFKSKVTAKQPPFAKNRLRDLERLQSINKLSKFQRRDIQTSVKKVNGSIMLAFFDKEIELPAFFERHIQFVRKADKFTVTDLPEGLDTDSQLEFLKLLVEEGLLEIILTDNH